MLSRRLISAFVLLACLATLGSSVVAQRRSAKPAASPGHPRPTTLPTPPLISLPASALVAELKAADGGSFTLSNYAGKVLVLNLWATWCGPCRMQVQSLVKLHEQYQSQGVEIVGLSTENPKGSAEEIREFIRDFDVPYRIGWIPSELALTLMQGRDAIPQTFVISPSGRIIRRFVGFNPIATPSQIDQAIKEALAEVVQPPEQN